MTITTRNKLLFFILFTVSYLGANAQLIQLNPQFCDYETQGWTSTNAYGVLYCESVPGANKYKFKADGGSNDPGYIAYRANTVNYVIIGQFGGMLDLTWYDISVAYSTDNGSTWSNFGPACPVRSPESPTTSLASQSCGIIINDFNQTLTAKYMPYCNTYRFRIYNLPGDPSYDETVLRSGGPWYEVSTVNLPVHFPTISWGYTYNCVVQWNNGGDWKPYGDICEITLVEQILMSSLFPDLSTISSAGGTIHNSSANNNLYILNNVGETITESIYVGNPQTPAIVLNQGFEQPSRWKVIEIINPRPGGQFSDRMYVENTIKVYPNPFSDELMVSSKSNRENKLMLRVLNSEGKFLGTYSINNPLESLDLNHLDPGSYFFEFSNSKQQKIETKKVIKSY